MNTPEEPALPQSGFEKKYVEKTLELNTFIYRLSHDLRGPVATIKGLTNNLLKLEIEDDSCASHVSMIEDSVNILDKIIHDLLSVVNTNSGVHTKASEINFNELLYKVMEKVGDSYDIFSSLFKINVNQPSPFIHYENLVFSVLYHLVNNAVQYKRPSVQQVIKIDIDQSLEGTLNLIHITVEDNGMGINKDKHEKIFNMFYKGNDLSSGAGLGLYLVKNYIDYMNGEIKFESTDREGSKFTISIPSIAV